MPQAIMLQDHETLGERGTWARQCRLPAPRGRFGLSSTRRR